MSPNIAIYYFSGTGNTEITAELFEKALEKLGAQVERTPMEALLKSNTLPNIQKYDLIGIGFPVHAINAPKIVYDFIKILPMTKGKKTFIFKTAGDTLSINNGASIRLVRKLQAKGCDVFYDSLIVMPANFAIKYAPELEKQLYLTAARKVERFSKEIINGTPHLFKATMLSRLVSWIGRLETLGAAIFGRYLKVSAACISCDKCIRQCPRQNIYRQDVKIKFRDKCIFCMRCIYQCPKKAITPRILKFSLLKEGYDLRKTIENTDIKGDFVTKETKGYYKRFYDYMYKN